MSGYVLEKKGLFVSVDECNIIRKTPDASRATVYSTQKKAMR